MSLQTSLFDDISNLVDPCSNESLFDELVKILTHQEEILDQPDLSFLEDIRAFIHKGTLFKTDTYYNIVIGSSEIVPTTDVNISIYKNDLRRKGKEFVPGAYYDLRFIVNSESYKIYQAYTEAKGSLSVLENQMNNWPLTYELFHSLSFC